VHAQDERWDELHSPTQVEDVHWAQQAVALMMEKQAEKRPGSGAPKRDPFGPISLEPSEISVTSAGMAVSMAVAASVEMRRSLCAAHMLPHVGIDGAAPPSRACSAFSQWLPRERLGCGLDR